MQQLQLAEGNGWYIGGIIETCPDDQGPSTKKTSWINDISVQKFHVSCKLFLLWYWQSMYRVMFVHGR